MKSASDITKILSARINKIIWFLGFHAFALILFVIFAELIFGGYIFYKYAFFPEKESPEMAGSVIKFNNESYQGVMMILNAKEPDGDEVIQ